MCVTWKEVVPFKPEFLDFKIRVLPRYASCIAQAPSLTIQVLPLGIILLNTLEIYE
jgi:hypothetical protein